MTSNAGTGTKENVSVWFVTKKNRGEGRPTRFNTPMGHLTFPLPTNLVLEKRIYSSSTCAKLNSSRPA